MDALWVAGSTTSLDYHVSSVVEFTWSMQVNGVIDPTNITHDYRVSPILHEDDLEYGRHTAVKFVNAYNNKHGLDPRKHLTLLKNKGKSFYYSSESLRYNEIPDPSFLLDTPLTPASFLEAMHKDLSSNFDKSFVLVGYGADFFRNLLLEYSKRVNIEFHQWLKQHMAEYVLDPTTLVMFGKIFNRVPLNTYRLNQVCEVLNIPLDKSSKSKLQATVAVVNEILSGALK